MEIYIETPPQITSHTLTPSPFLSGLLSEHNYNLVLQVQEAPPKGLPRSSCHSLLWLFF